MKLLEAFEILKDNDVAKSEREKVDFFLNGIQSDNQIIVTAKTTVRMNVAMRTSFQIAVDHLLELIGATFSNASNNGKRPAQNVSRLETGRGNRGRRGRGGRHGRGGQGGRGNHGGKFHNDVDITDLARTYTDEEWQKLTPEVHQQKNSHAAKTKKAADANNKKRNEPMGRKALAGEALQLMVDEVGIPDKMVFDGTKEQVGVKSEFMRTLKRYRVAHWQTEPYSPWQNRAEDQIREVQRQWKLMRQRMNIPPKLWDYSMVHITKLMNFTARGQNGRTGHEEITGETPDISEYVDFDFYDWVWYWDTPDKENSPKIGHWLSPLHRIGASMCFYVLAKTGEIVSRSSVQHLTQLEMMKDEIKACLEQFDNEVGGRLRNEGFECQHEYENAFYINDNEGDMEPEEPNPMPDMDNFTPEAYDKYVRAQMMIPTADGRIQGTITKWQPNWSTECKSVPRYKEI
jgi:ribosomal protein L15